MRESLLRNLYQNNAKNKALTVHRQGFILEDKV